METEIAYLLKSIIDTDTAPVVICDLDHKIVYMNPAAKVNYAKYGGVALIGRSLLDCHNERSREMIIKIFEWFGRSVENDRVHTFFNAKQNKDVYMIALRDDQRRLVGYYEKHEYRDRDMSPFYEMK